MYRIGIPAENLSTDPACVGLDPGVKPHVACKHVAAGKGSLTHVTRVSPAARVCRP
jgi:hypothetical protein